MSGQVMGSALGSIQGADRLCPQDNPQDASSMGPTHLGDEEEPQEVEGEAEHSQERHLPLPLPQGWELIHDGGRDGLDVPKLRDRDVKGVAGNPPSPGWSPQRPCPHCTEHTWPWAQPHQGHVAASPPWVDPLALHPTPAAAPHTQSSPAPRSVHVLPPACQGQGVPGTTRPGTGRDRGFPSVTITKVSTPSMKSIRKKRMDQKGEPGSRESASGYATNASPGPAGWRHQDEGKHRGAQQHPLTQHPVSPKPHQTQRRCAHRCSSSRPCVPAPRRWRSRPRNWCSSSRW